MQEVVHEWYLYLFLNCVLDVAGTVGLPTTLSPYEESALLSCADQGTNFNASHRLSVSTSTNPSNAEATSIQSTMMQKLLKTI